MMKITYISDISDKKNIALMDTSSISFMQGLKEKGILVENILKDYDLILIPQWVLNEINDSKGRIDYFQNLINGGYPIYSIEEERYSELVNNEEANLYQIVLASTYQIGRIKSYLRRYVEKADLLDMDEYREWISKLYEQWPIPGSILLSGREKKKNAGEISITILAEIISWYYPKTEILTIYSQDSDTYEWRNLAEETLRKLFISRTAIPVSYKSNDAILCQLFRSGEIDIKNINNYRKDTRKLTYSKKQKDQSIVLITEVVDNNSFTKLVKDTSVHIIF